MVKYYEVYKTLILAATLSGIYFSSIEKICGKKLYIKSLKFLCIVPGISLPLYFISMLKYQIFDGDGAENKIFGYLLLSFSSLMGFTFYSFYYYRYDFQKLFELWDSCFQEDLFPENRQALFTKSANLTNKWLKWFGSLTLMSCVMYCLLMYFTPTKTLNHPSGIPYRHQSPDFELLNTLDFIVGFFGFSGLIVFDSTTMTLLSIEEAELQHLKSSLAWIVDKMSVAGSGSVQINTVGVTDIHSHTFQWERAFEETRKQIKIWISHHQQVLRLHNEFQKIYSVPLSAKFTYFVLLICFICFLSLSGTFNIFDTIFSSLFCFNIYTLFYVNVMYADSVAEKGASIFEEAFARSWHLYPKDLKTTFHIIQMQSNRPLQYVAFKKYSLGSSSFLKILTSAYSLFTFMLQTNRKKIKTLEFQSPNP